MKMTVFWLLWILGLMQIAHAAQWSVQYQLGNAWNAKQDLHISADDPDTASYDDIRFEADFETRGLTTQPLYYSFRFGLQQSGVSTELELLHQKLYLANIAQVPELDRFEITHGFNMVFLNRAYELPGNSQWRIGAGTVASYPDISINGSKRPPPNSGSDPWSWLSSYYWGGYAVQLAVQKGLLTMGRHQLITELKLTHAKVKLPVSQGRLVVPNNAVHLLLGYSFGR